ncbi:radical SAM/Cys-rich domain protein [Halieaceae bacterium IMCC14734]|uniref:Radical SAM/Cys-rich domain protein n=1 Tax=Candidatus Litorirhabdus singularis TaxID=2518993 RepID=A0ABT3THW6_9GAMM|nr:arsenosugar biosynthesis radical SAM (seleno)protein ArsS [Candidatus Litorirhabdus singularis]MCX2981926.1 radical SAM/Cys-rich domain protein [Candidatus Litorirhabdus singularis]
MRETRPLLLNSDFPAIARQRISSLQINLGYRCNLSCVHCHVNAGPTRTEEMSLATTQQVVALMDRLQPATLDLTGGAPEMNPHFRWLVEQARQRDIEVIDRCNLTILLEPGYEDLAEFMAAQGVVITASLPCYEEENVAEQRGQGVYADSIQALQLLNQLGYGVEEDLQLNLVYNPVGTNLPPPQEQLQSDYKRELQSRFGISFNSLFTITNMPISRFGAVLLSQDQYYPYMRMLRESFATENLDSVMCRELISIDWQGFVYDCDFNQMLDMPVLTSDRRVHIADLLDGHALDSAAIYTAEHCYGCTAGQGSSCSGALDG